MSTSVAELKYGAYVFSPIPQIGIQEGVQRIGSDQLGAGSGRRVVTARGTLLGSDLNDVQTKVWALRNAFAIHGKTLYWKDGTNVRINSIAQPMMLNIPEQWGQYDAEYTISWAYLPLDDTHYNPFVVKYDAYTFGPNPVMGREFDIQRQSAQADRESTKVALTLSGFLDKGSLSANLTEWDTLVAALQDGKTFQYGTFTQTVRVMRVNYAPAVGSGRLQYTIVLEYDDDLQTTGVVRLSSSRQIQSSQRIAVNKTPFVNGSRFQRLGGNEQRVIANGFVVGETMAEARTAAATEIDSQFPASASRAEVTRNITEQAAAKRIEWNVQMIYPTPVLTGGVYGNLTI